MMEEQLLEVNKKIKQIQNVISKRRQKVSQCSLNYKKVLQQKQDKQKYISRVYHPKIDFKSLSPQDRGKICSYLNQKASRTRSKVKEFYNQLKDLDELTKQKNKVRLLVLQKKQQNKQSDLKININKRNTQGDKNTNKNINNQNISNILCRTIKDRVNPFQTVKANQFIQFTQQLKTNGQNIGPKLMKHFGVGLQTTPFKSLIKKQQKKQQYLNGENKKKLGTTMSKTSFSKAFNQTYKTNQKIFGSTYQPRNIFQHRLKKIIKYHGDFWNQEFKIN